MKSMGKCKKDVTTLLMHWSYVFLALTHRIVLFNRVDQELDDNCMPIMILIE